MLALTNEFQQATEFDTHAGGSSVLQRLLSINIADIVCYSQETPRTTRIQVARMADLCNTASHR